MYTSGQQHKDLTAATKPELIIYKGGKWAARIEKLSAISLLILIFLGVSLLWWPSIPAWSYLCTTVPAVFVCWTAGRLISGRTDIPGNFYHIAITVILLFATYHGLKDGLTKYNYWPEPLQGQFSGSLGLHFFIFAMLIMLCDDLFLRKSFVLTAFAAAGAIAGALFSMMVSKRPSGNAMLLFTGICGVISAIKLFVPMFLGRKDYSQRATVITKGVFLLSLIISAAMLAFAVIKGGKLSSDIITVKGFGDLALARIADDSGALVTLSAGLGIIAAAAIPAGFLLGCIKTTLGVLKDKRPTAALLAACDLLALSAVLAAWISPMGLFSPAVNILLAVNLSGNSRIFAATPARISGLFLLGATGWLCMLLGMISNMGLMVWVMGNIDNRDMVLHILFGLLITQMLLWLMDRWRFGAFFALAISLGMSAAGEFAQKMWSQRSFQRDDFYNHATGTAIAFGIYILCRLAANQQRTNDSVAKKPVR